MQIRKDAREKKRKLYLFVWKICLQIRHAVAVSLSVCYTGLTFPGGLTFFGSMPQQHRVIQAMNAV